ncbi:hypothetical protein JIR001_24640 [Polycladomyces abyssicola]|uniref:Anti-sigma-W factor RsiW n=1 Tax=Polycladomyces abyssicola TaxID=1125966 RepID=A0A8D5ZPR8_9BACL|nr:zf-HC2 domain-containing protein [Polycladomyces abyssicola]BCU82681.1 hypothetical protein JIR001_24640 [Polycladomyces abyssicola]
MSCRDMDQLIQLYVDREIEETDRMRLKSHVAECADCKRDLQDMIALVDTLENIRIKARAPHSANGLSLVRWVAVGISIFLLAYIPYRSEHDQTPVSSLSVSSISVAQNGAEETVDPEYTILATSADTVRIPHRDTVRILTPDQWPARISSATALVYPGALRFLIDQTGSDWYRQVDRLILVKVPDADTLRMLLKRVGEEWDGSTDHDIVQFPTSVVITPGEQPKVQFFSSPAQDQDILQWASHLIRHH